MNDDKKNKKINIDTIADALNVEPLEGEVQKYEAPKNTKTDNDYEYARDNLISAIEKGNEALETMLDLATQSQNPRAFEVFSTLLKTITDSNKDLLELSRKKQLLDKEDGNPKNLTQTANFFVGSTHDLQKLFKKMRNDGDE